MNSSVLYREATLADVASVCRIRAAAWGSEEYWHDRITGYMGGTVHPRESLRPRVVFVAEQTHIIGLIAGHLTRRFRCDGELEWLDVVAERRREGVAEGLLRTLARWFCDHAATRICVDVDPTNAPARAFYEEQGAEEMNPHWLMWRDITPLAERL